MSDSWYTSVEAVASLTQGDLILDCPIITWMPSVVELRGAVEADVLKASMTAQYADVVVMTQACDLEQNRIANVILCPHLELGEYRRAWTAELETMRQNPTEKAWKRHIADIKDGHMWNLAILNKRDDAQISTCHRVVDFHEVFTVPRTFLESYLSQRGTPRLRLLAPYREHLSQAFARFFMRVGLPTPVAEMA